MPESAQTASGRSGAVWLLRTSPWNRKARRKSRKQASMTLNALRRYARRGSKRAAETLKTLLGALND